MNSLHIVQLEAKLGLLAAVIEEERQEGGRDSRRIEIPLLPAAPQQRAEWQQLAGRSALDLYRLLGEASELTVQFGGRKQAGREVLLPPGKQSGSEAAAVRTTLPLGGGEAAWELAAADKGGGPEVMAALEAAAEVVRTNAAFGLMLAGIEPAELAAEAMAGWSDDWEAPTDEPAPKAAPRAAAEGGGREIAEWIAAAAEKGVLHEHGRLPDESSSEQNEAAPHSCDLSLLPDTAAAESALAELRRAMRARMNG
ncbi:hypothetical protein [Saccharibacillus kuerlensis]|uniref:Uncharacterized protein n=1 Tax=Saccharibacillus kuerlensis TaxID=459527 RepID=A0ABQ2L1N3_9BACL|nr:hypothetical protein [Saccharibacillus kuerlensis]GGN99676.1 hypothetical protein GCM10010969_19980 [Saccharibacillus kuerlensis]